MPTSSVVCGLVCAWFLGCAHTESNASIPKVMGSLDKEAIRAVIKSHRSQLNGCYLPRLSEAPQLAGNIHVKFVISPSGGVSTASVERSTVNDADLEACVVQAVAGWAFPEPKGGGIVQVKYPFIFKSQAEPEPTSHVGSAPL
jgi:TonB family protein